MKKVIRLTESDLMRIVKRVINENKKFGSFDDEEWYDEDDKFTRVDDMGDDFDDEEFNDFDSFSSKHGHDTKWFGKGDSGRKMFDTYKDKHSKPFKVRTRRGMNEQTNTISPKRVKFFDTLANNISSKLIGKKLYFGNIGVLGNTSITIKSYGERNQNINFQGMEVKDFVLFFNVVRDKEDLNAGEKPGTRVWSGELEVRAEFKNGVISKNPIVNLYPTLSDDSMKPERPWTWDQVGGAQIWNQALNGNKL